MAFDLFLHIFASIRKTVITMPKFKYILIYTILPALWALSFLYGCGSSVEGKPVITVSIQPQKYLLEKIAGDKWDVKCLLSNGANPESYDPSLTHLLNIENSTAYFRIGNIPFESAIITKVTKNKPNLKIIDSSTGIALITGTHSGHAGDLEIDPHTWTSVKNAKKIASNMYNGLVEIDPSNKDTYTKNFKKLLQSLDSLDNSIKERLDTHRGEAFIVWHPSLSYFARDYGLRQISLSPEGKEASITMMQTAIDQAKEAGAKVLFFQKDVDSRQATVANEQIGATLVNINPLNYNWEEEITVIADALSQQ